MKGNPGLLATATQVKCPNSKCVIYILFDQI